MTAPSELEFWADCLLRQPDNPEPVHSRIVDLLSAFAVGLKTDEGRALARLHDGQRDGADIAATVAALLGKDYRQAVSAAAPPINEVLGRGR